MSASPTSSDVTTQRKYETLGLILLGVGLLALVDIIYSPGGNYLLRTIAGKGALPLAIILVAIGLFFTFYRLLSPRIGTHWYPEALLGIELLFICGLVVLHLLLDSPELKDIYAGEGGGLIGWAIGDLLVQNLGTLPTWAVLLGVGLLGFILVWQYTPLSFISLSGISVPVVVLPEKKAGTADTVRTTGLQKVAANEVQSQTKKQTKKKSPGRGGRKTASRRKTVPAKPLPRQRRSKKLPPLSLLEMDDSGGSTNEQAQIQARVIEDTLMSFDIPATVTEINVGPTVTQFGVRPGTFTRGGRTVRVRVSKIVSLHDDLALALAASSVRIEAPVPGRPIVGIEVPNKDISLVSLRRLLEDREFRRIRSPLAIPFGRDVSGVAVADDLRRLPHLLIAGATGSGKSVALNAIICTLLFNNLPNALRLILVDPKRVELPGYNGVPHLLSPVVTDSQHAEGALTWLLIQMDDRYELFRKAGVRNIAGYNKKVSSGQRLPYFVMIIDELADLMVTAPEIIETRLVRLAQMSRATGIHLIIATQRPSVDIVTGLIKANFPARLAFAVTSQIDSRVILDSPGADKLLGRGDGLLMRPDSPQLTRVQGCFVSDSEIQALVAWWKEHAPPAEEGSVRRYPWSHLLVEQATADDMVQKAIDSLQGRQHITVSGLQRMLSISYPRASRLMEELEAAGVVGPEIDKRTGRPVLLEEEDLSYE